ncbi:glycoside hydrolase family 5 protein [Melioribacter sp. Ez-97]|uniref:glycoside hydrolase family 5 protein n=1 Tax=Melioribacter sp. Ez-97 TaxID=3423434 RepID=UPI003EDABD40
MKNIIKLIILFLFASKISFTNAQETKYHAWWHDSYLKESFETPDKKKLPLIKVEGNRFVNENGDTVLFRGVSISDPDKIANQGYWNKKHFEKVRELGTMIVRIPVHPIAWRERGEKNYLKLLDQAVEWCTELGMYIIIDWHTIGNLGMELFQDPMYETTKKETFEFWRTIARRYSGNNTVAFYELFNEPTLYFNQLGIMSWTEWKELNEKMIALIRAYDAETIPLVAGFDWAYDLTPLLIEPVEAENIGYVTHPYPHKRTKPWEPKWEENFGFAARKYPVIATEIGFTMGDESINSNGEYGEAIINYLESKGISWVWWVFDPEWHPKMFESWDTYKLTDSGKFYKAVMEGKK